MIISAFVFTCETVSFQNFKQDIEKVVCEYLGVDFEAREQWLKRREELKQLKIKLENKVRVNFSLQRLVDATSCDMSILHQIYFTEVGRKTGERMARTTIRGRRCH